MLCQCFRKEIPFLQAQNSDDLLCVIEDMNITYPIENNSPCGLTKNFTLSNKQNNDNSFIFWKRKQMKYEMHEGRMSALTKGIMDGPVIIY